MNYYRISFRKTLNPQDVKPLHRYDWYEMVVQASNYEDARNLSMALADKWGMHYCAAIRLPRDVGKRLFQATPGVYRVGTVVGHELREVSA